MVADVEACGGYAVRMADLDHELISSLSKTVALESEPTRTQSQPNPFRDLTVWLLHDHLLRTPSRLVHDAEASCAQFRPDFDLHIGVGYAPRRGWFLEKEMTSFASTSKCLGSFGGESVAPVT